MAPGPAELIPAQDRYARFMLAAFPGLDTGSLACGAASGSHNGLFLSEVQLGYYTIDANAGSRLSSAPVYQASRQSLHIYCPRPSHAIDLLIPLLKTSMHLRTVNVLDCPLLMLLNRRQRPGWCLIWVLLVAHDVVVKLLSHLLGDGLSIPKQTRYLKTVRLRWIALASEHCHRQ